MTSGGGTAQNPKQATMTKSSMLEANSTRTKSILEMTNEELMEWCESNLDFSQITMLYAETETRIREIVLKLIRPALDETRKTIDHLNVLSERVAEHHTLIDIVGTMRDELRAHVEQVTMLQDRVSAEEDKCRGMESAGAEERCRIRLQVEADERRLDAQQDELNKYCRDTTKLWSETTTLQEKQHAAVAELWDGIRERDEREEQARGKIMEMIYELQEQRQNLHRHLFDEEAGLIPSLGNEQNRIGKEIRILPTLEGTQRLYGERLNELEEARRSIADAEVETRKGLNSLRNDAEGMVATLRSDFNRAHNKVVAHHAHLMQEVRKDYEQDISVAREARAMYVGFQEKMGGVLDTMGSKLHSHENRLDALHRELTSDIDELRKKHRKDRIALDTAVRESRSEVEVEHDLCQKVRADTDFLGRIIGLVLEGERVASAMVAQDFADRCEEKWLTLRGEVGASASSHVTWGSLQQGSYWPGKVPFAGTNYDRHDILTLHQKLLKKAHDAFQRYPLPASTAQAGVAGGQPAASPRGHASDQSNPAGRRHRSDSPHGSYDRNAEQTAKARSPAPSGRSGRPLQHREGSRGQPEAVGSRGGDHGGPRSAAVELSGAVGSACKASPLGEMGSAAALKLPRLDDKRAGASGSRTAR